ncbi:unnamed protein product, partial [marine sediment metagenome]
MKIQLITTFGQLHDKKACKDRYRHLAKALGGIRKYGRTKPINLLAILEHNGLDDFFWVLGIIKDHQILRAMAADFAESVLPIFEKQYPADKRPREAIEVARRYARGEATAAAWAATGAAARAAARAATGAAAWAAARAAAGAATGAAAWAAARAAAGAAARAAAWAAAGDAARAAAWAAAGDAARAAAWAAAGDAEREKQ